VDNTQKYFRHLSLCSGYEGIGLGLRRVFRNVIEVAHVEIESYAICSMVSKMEENKIPPAPIWTDLKTFPYEKFLGKVDILSGGFPCQPFSSSGKRQFTKDPRHLYPYISDGIGKCRPRFVFMENVEGIISAKTEGGESVLLYVLRDLESMGYISEAGIFSASEVGAPHQRKRVFIMGYSSDDGRTQNSPLRDKQQTTRPSEIGSKRHGKKVGNSDSSRKHECKRDKQKFGRRTQDSSHEMADSENIRCRRGENRGADDGKRIQIPEENKRKMVWGEVKRCSREWQNWPSPPGKEQHQWEEPRTTFKPKLGGGIDGSRSGVDSTSNRLDRLRLLGNGVVPQVAEKAFRILSQRIKNRIK
tara:strand:+ start:838 stop:1914 length:1077 start_codon:yes stop_codon:yes gene_type:complete